MKAAHIKILTICAIFLGGALQLHAQIAEEILTESSEPEEVEEIMITPLDDIVPKRILKERMVLPYDPIREADLFWEKRIWRVLDIREKINRTFSYPIMPFFSILMNGVSEGDLSAYADEKFTNLMGADQIQEILYRVDTVFVTNPETFEDEMKLVPNEINPEDVKRFRVKEIWFFDEESSKFMVRIMGISPVIDKYDDNGEFLFEQPLFWIHYPSSREFLARHKAYISGNDANPLSWEDLFEMRIFSSYIYKESNVDDARLVDIPSLAGKDLNSGVQRLLESEKIKQELFNFEHDLWSY
ncbi:MAG: gliding motility protein GldN [Saprospiraceae bacterium]|nr:gliding motility protein GldN [Saprospiraceae bacterium]